MTDAIEILRAIGTALKGNTDPKRVAKESRRLLARDRLVAFDAIRDAKRMIRDGVSRPTNELKQFFRGSAWSALVDEDPRWQLLSHAIEEFLPFQIFAATDQLLNATALSSPDDGEPDSIDTIH